MKIHSEDAYHLLYRLGATANYTGFSYLVRALQLCAEEPERLLLVTKWLYPDVAKQYGTNWKAVERDIRTMGRVIWNSNRPLLETLARRSRGTLQARCRFWSRCRRMSRIFPSAAPVFGAYSLWPPP